MEFSHINHLHNSIIHFWYICDISPPNVILSDQSIRYHLSDILYQIKHGIDSTSDQTIHKSIYLSILQNMFCFIAHSRDIKCGLGHRFITYLMLDVWYEYYPVLAISAMHGILTHGYGSWRDVCGLQDYFVNHSTHIGSFHPLIDHAIEFMNSTLHKDWRKFKKTGLINTNVAKWIPRETSKHKAMFKRLSQHWTSKYTPYMVSTNDDDEFATIRKCNAKYRKMISAMTSVVPNIEYSDDDQIQSPPSQYDFYQFFEIMESKRYTSMQNVFQQVTSVRQVTSDA
jgi:hypothetical protein